MCIKLPIKKCGLNIVVNLFLLLGLSTASVFANEEANRMQGPDQSVFWAIEKDGSPVGHLLGTIHSEDPRVLDFSEKFLSRLKLNKMFAMELVPNLPTLARLTEFMNYPQGQTLESVIGSERYLALTNALAVYKVPAGYVERMKPWAAMMTISTPPPQTGFFMDLSLSLRASGSGLKVVGLETLEQQLSFLEEMPLQMQLSLLDQAIAEAANVRDAHDQLVVAYLENDLQRLVSLTDEEFMQVTPQARDYFLSSGIVQRNHRMLNTLLPLLASSSVFTAVGALHLPGEDGLISLLRQEGFDLIPLEMPFIQE
jgi:uncharacterized protein YbaP (TraB family)